MIEHDDRRCSTALVEVSTWSFGKRKGGCKWRQERKPKARPRQSARRPRPPRRRTTRSAGGAYRRRDPLLQPPVSRDPAGLLIRYPRSALAREIRILRISRRR